MRYTFNLRLLSVAHLQVIDLIERGLLTPVRGSPISGCSTTLKYRLSDPEVFKIKDDFGVSIGGHLLQINLFKLPSWAYQAVVRERGILQHHAADLLTEEVLSGEAHTYREEWIERLCDSVRVGMSRTEWSPMGNLDVVLVARVRWCAEQSEICQVDPSRPDSPWMIVLAFDRDERVEWEWGERLGAVGVDVGSHPLVVAAEPYATWQIEGVRRVPITEEDLLPHLRDRRQIHLAQRLHHMTHTVAARTQYERALKELERASTIYVEDLDMRGMMRGFRHTAHELGLQDFLLSWLPQMAYAHAIGLYRVPPAYTSRMCHLCHREGTRSSDGRVFTCRTHGTMDAHNNAAQVIRQTGANLARERLEHGPKGGRTRYVTSL